MNKKKFKNIFWIILSIVILACVGNVLYAIFATSSRTTNILTAISGWISGIATLAIGIIAYLQNRKYQEAEEIKEKYVDVIVESLWIDSIKTPQGQMLRQSMLKDIEQYSGQAFYLNVFNFSDKPIFDIRIESIKIDNKVYEYDSIQPIYKDMHGRSFLSENGSIWLLANIPKNYYDANYVIKIKMKNQYDEWYQKEVLFNYSKNILPHCYGIKQNKATKG